MKRMKKRVFAQLVYAVLLFGVLLLPVYAEGASITMTPTQVDAEMITVSVDISEASDAAMLQFAVGYDPEMLEVLSVSVGSVFSGKSAPTVNAKVSGRIYLAWDALAPLEDGGSLLVIRAKQLHPEQRTALFVDLNEEFVVMSGEFEEIPTATPDLILEGKQTEAAQPEKNTGTPDQTANVPTEPPTGSNNGLTLDRNAVTISPAQKQQLTVAEKDEPVFWESSNEAVAVVENGEIIAIGEGDAIITAFSEDGINTATCHVTVAQEPEGQFTWIIPAVAVIIAALVAAVICRKRSQLCKTKKKEGN